MAVFTYEFCNLGVRFFVVDAERYGRSIPLYAGWITLRVLSEGVEPAYERLLYHWRNAWQGYENHVTRGVLGVARDEAIDRGLVQSQGEGHENPIDVD